MPSAFLIAHRTHSFCVAAGLNALSRNLPYGFPSAGFVPPECESTMAARGCQLFVLPNPARSPRLRQRDRSDPRLILVELRLTEQRGEGTRATFSEARASYRVEWEISVNEEKPAAYQQLIAESLLALRAAAIAPEITNCNGRQHQSENSQKATGYPDERPLFEPR